MTRFDNAITGAMCLIIGWSAGTLVHECCHLVGAYSFGLPTTLGTCTLTTGSVFVHGDMTAVQTAVIAVVGSLGLVIAGVLMVKLSDSSVVRMIGVVFLCRAWIDVLPISGMDGGLIAGSVGYAVALVIVVAEVVVCGSVMMEQIQ